MGKPVSSLPAEDAAGAKPASASHPDEHPRHTWPRPRTSTRRQASESPSPHINTASGSGKPEPVAGGSSSEQGLPESGLSQHPGLHSGAGKETVPLCREWWCPGGVGRFPDLGMGVTRSPLGSLLLHICRPCGPGPAPLCPWAGPAAPASDRDAAACHTPLLPRRQPGTLCAQGWCWVRPALPRAACP